MRVELRSHFPGTSFPNRHVSGLKSNRHETPAFRRTNRRRFSIQHVPFYALIFHVRLSLRPRAVEHVDDVLFRVDLEEIFGRGERHGRRALVRAGGGFEAANLIEMGQRESDQRIRRGRRGRRFRGDGRGEDDALFLLLSLLLLLHDDDVHFFVREKY